MPGFLPFRIDFGARAIDDLHRRIDATRWPDVGYDTGWSTGTSDAVLRDLVRYWRRDFDWAAQQERLNRLAHIRGPVDGEELHAVLYQGAEGASERLPLLLVHGWPGSFVEFLDAAPLLAGGVDGGPGYDLVVPSLPGFAFSDAPRAPGMHPGRMAERLHGLMRALGYERYGVQGGDWGAIVGTALALRHPEAVAALHVNFLAGARPPAEGEAMSEEERAYREFRQRFEAEETGYSRIQGTRPQSLAYAQHDSPVGLLAWILEKFWAWTDHPSAEEAGDAALWETLDRDRVLTNVTLYWLTGSVLSAARVYYEMSHATERVLGARVEMPTGYLHLPAEPWAAPREVAERGFNLVHYTKGDRGGHFAALEQPALYARDVAKFFSAFPAGE